MANPTTTYESGFPDIIFPGNLKRERTDKADDLFTGRDLNILSQEIVAMQSNIGTSPVQGWKVGDETIYDKLTKLGGTGVCPEGGTYCTYFGPSGTDPQATGYVATTGQWFGDPWISPTGIFGTPTDPGVPGIPGQPPQPPFGGPLSNQPWKQPGVKDEQAGGPKPPQFPGDGDGFDGRDFYPPGEPVEPEWAIQNHLLYQNFLSEALSYRVNTLSAENIFLQPLTYAQVLPLFRALVEMIDEWPSARTKPSQLGVVSVFDAFYPTAGLAKQVAHRDGIEWYKGTIANDGTYVSFTGTNVNFGPQGVDPTKLGYIFSNLDIPELSNTNISEWRTHPGDVKQDELGVVTGEAVYKAMFTTPVPADHTPTGNNIAEVLVGVSTGWPNIATPGSNQQWATDQKAVAAGTATLDNIPADNNDGFSIAVVLASSGGGAWVPLSVEAAQTDTTNCSISAAGVITVDASYTEVYVMYMYEV